MKQSSGALSTSGKALVATNAGAICSSIAALTSLRTLGSVHFKASFEDFFQGRRSAYHATDHQSRMGDLAYLKNLGQCFSFELCRYSRISPTCQSVVRSGLEHIISHFLEALVDPEILHRLPSSNKAIISRSGGPKAQEMEVKYLKRMLRRSPSGDQEDDEAIGTRLIDNEMFDSPGPAFMASRLWSFGRSLGNLIGELSPDDQEVARVGKVLSATDGDLEGDALESCRRSLALVPLISMERECMKRVVMLRSIVSVLSEDHIIGRAATNVIALLTKSVMQNIYYLSATVEYNERRTGDWEANPNADPEDLYERARALALQHAYGEVAASFSSWLLYQGAHSNNLHRLNPTVTVLKDVLLRTSLLKSSTKFCSALEVHSSKSIRPYVFDVLASRGGSSSGNGRLTEDLCDGLGRRYHELVVYAADSFDLSGTSDVLSMLIESALVASSGDDTGRSQMLGLALRGHSRGASSNILHQQDDLQRATDSYFLTFHSFKPTSNRTTALLGKLRRAALRNFIIPKLRFDAIEMAKKAKLLNILHFLIGANDGSASDIIIRSHEETPGYLDVSDLSLLLRGISHVLKEWLACTKSNSSQNMVLTIFQVAKAVLHLPITKGPEEDGTEALLTWSHPTSDSSEELCRTRTYISLHLRWWSSMARLLTNDTIYRVIQRIAIQAQKSKGDAQIWDTDILSDLEPPADCPGEHLEAIRTMLTIAADVDKLDIEMYPEDRLQTPGKVAVTNVYAKRPAASISSVDRNGEASSATVLGPRCKRVVKEYISEYLSFM